MFSGCLSFHTHIIDFCLFLALEKCCCWAIHIFGHCWNSPYSSVGRSLTSHAGDFPRGKLRVQNQGFSLYLFMNLSRSNRLVAGKFHLVILTETRIGSTNVSRNKAFYWHGCIIVVENTCVQFLIRLSNYCAWVFSMMKILLFIKYEILIFSYAYVRWVFYYYY